MPALSIDQALAVAREVGVDLRRVLMTHAYLERLAESPVTAADTIAYLLRPDRMTLVIGAGRSRTA